MKTSFCLFLTLFCVAFSFLLLQIVRVQGQCLCESASAELSPDVCIMTPPSSLVNRSWWYLYQFHANKSQTAETSTLIISFLSPLFKRGGLQKKEKACPTFPVAVNLGVGRLFRNSHCGWLGWQGKPWDLGAASLCGRRHRIALSVLSVQTRF